MQTFIRTPDIRSELVWAELECQIDDTQYWRFYGPSGEELVPVSARNQLFRSMRPAGEYLVANVGAGCRGYDPLEVVPIPELRERGVIEQQVSWVADERRFMLTDIWALLPSIPDPCLHDFYYEVLTDRGLMRALLNGKASHAHHHNQSGELLDHSYEVAWTAATLCLQHGLGPLNSCIAFIGGLLHDIGKIHLFYNSPDGVCGQHEAYSFLVLARPLEQLRVRAPRVFEALSSCWDIHIPSRQAAYLAANMVWMCDRLSVEVNNWRRAFKNVPHYYHYVRSADAAHLYKRIGNHP